MNDNGFSVVIPLYNEKESINELLANLKKVLEKFKKPYEIIFIDDGSTDNSLDLLKNLEGRKNHIKIFSFRKNLGKSHALMLGFKMARKKYIVTMDADLQDDPKNIPLLYEKLKKGNYDMVTGWRKYRKDTYFKKISSKLFNKTISFLFNIKINDLNSGLKIYKNEVARDLRLYGGMHRFIPLLAHELGYQVGEKEISHLPRKYGQSKYMMTKVITDVPDMLTIYFLTKYTGRPLHFFGRIGTIILFIGLLVLFYLAALRIMGEKIGDRPLLLFGVLLVIIGMQINFTGLLADLMVNMHAEKENNNFPIKYASGNKISH